MTLFFLQLFLTVTTNGDDLFGHNVTGGANGILNVDPLSLFGRELPVAHDGIFNVAYMYVVLAVFVVVYVALRFVNLSRTGRAWRSLREDPLAAEVMGMPVKRAQADELCLRGLHRSSHRHTGLIGERERLPALVLVPAPDHHLHDGHPRRLRQPGRASCSGRS